MEAETDKTIVHFNKRYILLVLIKRKEKKDEKKNKENPPQYFFNISTRTKSSPRFTFVQFIH